MGQQVRKDLCVDLGMAKSAVGLNSSGEIQNQGQRMVWCVEVVLLHYILVVTPEAKQKLGAKEYIRYVA